MTQDIQEIEPEPLTVEMKLLKTEALSKWKDCEEEVVEIKKDRSEKRNYLIFGGSVIGVSIVVYGLSKLVHYITGR
jgi:hypothetical protein